MFFKFLFEQQFQGKHPHFSIRKAFTLIRQQKDKKSQTAAAFFAAAVSDVKNDTYSMAEPPVITQAAIAATVKAPVYTLPVRR